MSQGMTGPRLLGRRLTSAIASPALWRTLVLTFALIWPALLNKGALPYPDTISYLRGGAVAIEKVTQMIAPSNPAAPAAAQPVQADPQSASTTEEDKEGIVGMRSAPYSVFTYVMGLLSGSGLMIVAAQTLMVAYTVVLFLRAIAPELSSKWFFAITGFTALFTAAPWYGGFAMPDILGAGALLSTIMLFHYRSTLNIAERLAIIAITAFAITAHPSNVLLIVGISGFCGSLMLLKDVRAKTPFSSMPSYLWAGAPLALGLAAMLAVSFIGFGQASVTPKRYPFALARSVTDGPALWHLEEHCDTYNYTVCEVFDEIPVGVGEFLWEKTGLRYRATPEQMDLIRAEEMIIVQRAAREYPMAQFRKAAYNTYRQIVRVGIPGIIYGSRIEQTGAADWRLAVAAPEGSWFIQPLETLQIATIYLSFGILAFLGLRANALSGSEWRLLALLVVALLGNAVICGVLSGPADRYQGRLIWLIPLVASVFLANYRMILAKKTAIASS